MIAPDVAALVDQFTPLALGVAAKWGRRFPWLADDFASDAALALWKVARDHSPDKPPFGARVRVVVKFAIIDRLKVERRRNPLAFYPRGAVEVDGRQLDPLDLAVAREQPIGAALEVADLLERLPADRRAEVTRHYLEGATLTEIGAARGVTRSAVSLRVRECIAELREAMKGHGLAPCGSW